MSKRRHLLEVWALASIAAAAVACGGESSESGGSATGTSPGSTASAVDPAALELKRIAILDVSHGNTPAAVFTLPASWNGEGQAVWNYDDVSLPVSVSAWGASPDGTRWVQTFPTQGFYWLEPPSWDVPRGARYLGMIHLPPPEAAEALMRFVIEPARGQEEGLEVLGVRPIEDLPGSLGERSSPGQGLAMRVRYRRGDVVMAEEFLAHYVRTTGQAAGIVQHNAYLELIHSLAAPESEFETHRPLLTAVARSFEAVPEWLTMQQQVVQRLNQQFQAQIAAGYAQIAAARRASQMISQTYDEIRAMNRASHDYYNQVTDRAHQQFSDAIRGVDRMQDPLWGQSEQPYEFEYHWTDGNGNYRHSNDPLYDPNLQPGPQWERMKRVP